MDIAILQDHIVTTHKSVPFKKNLLSKLKSIMDIPNKQGFSMVQTVCKNIEGFTKQDLQGAYLVCVCVLSWFPDRFGFCHLHDIYCKLPLAITTLHGCLA